MKNCKENIFIRKIYEFFLFNFPEQYQHQLHHNQQHQQLQDHLQHLQNLQQIQHHRNFYRSQYNEGPIRPLSEQGYETASNNGRYVGRSSYDVPLNSRG